MARQRGAPGLVIGSCIVEIDRIVIRKVQYQLGVNRCRNEEIIVKGNFGWVWSMWAGSPRFDNGAMHKIQQCKNEEIIVKGNFGWVWPMLAGRPRVGNGVIHIKGNFGWVWSMWKGRPRVGNGVMHMNRCKNEEIIARAPGLVMGPCKVEIYRIVIREVQRCKNEEVIVKGNCGWVWPMWSGHPRIDRIVIREIQYQFEVNRCRNEEIIVKGNFGWAILGGYKHLCGQDAPGLVMGPCIVEIDSIFIREIQYQFEVNRCRNEEVNVK
ncbi:hypothetical protein DPMN_041291 [Dreissena polymorpha]|uniref:Uncharacterized protein n=1 Tax=Dreissena polymorpha TaxID=45954 RepID=A0A9D4CZ29_DREPO|nr:hypothetical protein DPMN_041291 [Dreissena polymorpha]